VNVFSASSRETACSGCQSSPENPFNALARNRGIKFGLRFTALNRRVRTATDDHAGFQERLPGAGAGDRFGVPLALIYGMDVPVDKNEIGMFSRIHGLK
jgi:hypothetical protein